jgi:hypothetical protein
MQAALDRLNASVARNSSVDDSAIALIEGLAQAIRDNVPDPTALNKIADDLDANSDKLAASVTANTPAAKP